MTVLLALVLGAGLLFAWLCDHWFARVLTFLVLFVPCWFAILFMIRGFNSTDGRGLFALFAGGGVAWGISWLPHLYYAAREKRVQQRRMVMFPSGEQDAPFVPRPQIMLTDR